MQQTNVDTGKKCFLEEVKKFYEAEEELLNYLQSRWMDESEYENPQDYKDVIKERAKKYNLNVSNVFLDRHNLGIQISIKNKQNYVAFIKILKTQNKIVVK